MNHLWSIANKLLYLEMSYLSMSSKQRKYDVPIDERCIKLIPSAIAYNLFVVEAFSS